MQGTHLKTITLAIVAMLAMLSACMVLSEASEESDAALTDLGVYTGGPNNSDRTHVYSGMDCEYLDLSDNQNFYLRTGSQVRILSDLEAVESPTEADYQYTLENMLQRCTVWGENGDRLQTTPFYAVQGSTDISGTHIAFLAHTTENARYEVLLYGGLHIYLNFKDTNIYRTFTYTDLVYNHNDFIVGDVRYFGPQYSSVISYWAYDDPSITFSVISGDSIQLESVSPYRVKATAVQPGTSVVQAKANDEGGYVYTFTVFVESADIERTGSGTQSDPYLYRLPANRYCELSLTSAGSFAQWFAVSGTVTIPGITFENYNRTSSTPSLSSTSGFSSGQTGPLIISGTPTTNGTWDIWTHNPANELYYRIQVYGGVTGVPVTSITITGPEEAPAYENVEYSLALSPSNATVKDVVWFVSDPLVTIMESTNSSIVINGHVGTVTIYAEATDGSGVVGSKTVSLVTRNIEISSEPPTVVMVGTPFTYEVKGNVSGFDLTIYGAEWLSASGDVVYGVPSSPGQYYVLLQISKDGYSTVRQQFTVTVISGLEFTSEPSNGLIAVEV